MKTGILRRGKTPQRLTLQTEDGKTYEQMSKKEKDILAQVLKWKEKTLKDCSRGELIDCIVHTTQHVVILQHELEKVKKQRGLRMVIERLKNWWRKNIARYLRKGDSSVQSIPVQQEVKPETKAE